MDLRVTDTLLVTGKRDMGKTHLLRAFILPYLKQQSADVRFHRSPTCVKKLMSGTKSRGIHHVIDDFDQVPIGQLGNILPSIQRIAMAGRHSNTGLTIIVHHPTWTAKEFRLTPDHIFAFCTPSEAGKQWLKPYFYREVDRLPDLPPQIFMYWGRSGRYLCRLKQLSGQWQLTGVPLATAGSRQSDIQSNALLDESRQ